MAIHWTKRKQWGAVAGIFFGGLVVVTAIGVGVGEAPPPVHTSRTTPANPPPPPEQPNTPFQPSGAPAIPPVARTTLTLNPGKFLSRLTTRIRALDGLTPELNHDTSILQSGRWHTIPPPGERKMLIGIPLTPDPGQIISVINQVETALHQDLGALKMLQQQIQGDTTAFNRVKAAANQTLTQVATQEATLAQHQDQLAALERQVAQTDPGWTPGKPPGKTATPQQTQINHLIQTVAQERMAVTSTIGVYKSQISMLRYYIANVHQIEPELGGILHKIHFLQDMALSINDAVTNTHGW